MPETRKFTESVAVRKRVPLLIALIGPSGGGKTPSALRLATGIQRVTGGKIHGFDTESDRMLHYSPAVGQKADPSKLTFDFHHVPFGAPFGPLDYLAALQQFVGPDDIAIVDSISHEHEGPGGVLEMHAAQQERLSGGDYKKYDSVNFLAWAKPKSDRRKLINALLQMKFGAVIFCFRAKEKIKMVKERGGNGRDKTVVINQGWQAIGGEEFVYEMTTRFLLPPGANGVPRWEPEEEGEKETMRLPAYFVNILTGESRGGPGAAPSMTFPKGRQIDEAMGEGMARWAAGGSVDGTTAPREVMPAVSGALRMIDFLVGDGQATEAELLEFFKGQKGVPTRQQLEAVKGDAGRKLVDAACQAIAAKYDVSAMESTA